MKKWTQIRTTPLRALLVGAGISAAAFMASTVISAPPPANAVIGNQASATYVDLAGKTQEAQSNLVTTTVAQVAKVDVLTSNEKSALVGNTVYMPHSLVNNGNGTDTFRIEVDGTTTTSKYTNIAIYPDANGTGVPSSTTPLCSDTPVAGVPSCSEGYLQTLPAGEKFNFVVAYTVPTSATAGLVDTTTVKATSQFDPTQFNSETDKINVTTGAVFAATKAVKVPGVAAAAGSWPAAVTVGKPSPSSCPTAWTATLVANNPTCQYTTYTVSFTNTGGAAGTFTMNDVLPSGLTYVTDSAVWSGAGGTALFDDSGTLTANTGTAANVKSSYDVTSKTLKASVANVGQNVSGTISFVVLINSTATSDNNDASTTNVAKYWSIACDPAQAASATNCGAGTTPGGEPPVATNPSPIPVADTFGVIAADNNGTGNTVDSGVPTNKTDDSAGDKNLIIVPKVEQGGKATFTNYVFNTGSTTDTFNVSVPVIGTADRNNFPAGTTFSFYKADGVTPLTDTNSDGIVDTGPIAKGADAVKIVMVATLPSGATISTNDLYALFTATSTKDVSKSDYVWNVVSEVVAPTSKVDLTNTATGNKTSTNGSATTPTLVDCVAGSNCDLGQGPSTNPTFTDTTQPGVTVDFPVFIDNNTGASGTFDLTVHSLPPGWTATFTTDATCPGTPITSVTLAAGEQDKKVLACITPPPGTPEGTTNVDIVVTKQGDPSVTDTLRDAVIVDVPNVPNMQLGPDSGTPKVNTGGTVDQPTTLTNPGTTSCGTADGGLKATVTVTGATAGWSGTLYYDKNANGIVDAGDVAQTTLFTAGTPNVFKLTTSSLGTSPAHSIPLAPGAKLPLIVKIYAPSGAPKGEVGTATLVIDSGVAADAAGYCPADTATFNATVLVGQVRVYKKHVFVSECTTANVGAATGFTAEAITITPDATKDQCVVYEVKAVNEGDAPVKNVKISDVVPGYTDYAATTLQPATQCATSAAGSVSFAYTAADKAVTCGTVADMQPGQDLTLKFSVILQK